MRPLRNRLSMLSRPRFIRLGQRITPNYTLLRGAIGSDTLRARWAQTVNVTDGTAYNEVVGLVIASRGVPPYSYSKVSGDASLTINASTGEVTYVGTAVHGTNPSATFRASDSGADPDVDVLVVVLVRMPSLQGLTFDPPSPTVAAYDPTPEFATRIVPIGGTPPITYEIESMEEV